MSDKVRYPYAVALQVAQDLKNCLLPFCEKIEIAGSLRRHRAHVGDIELLFVPKLVPPPQDLLPGLIDKKPISFCNATNEAIEQLLSVGVIQKRKNSKGSFIWGEQNKLAVHVGSQIPVDFFSTTPKNWFVSLVIRTGGKQTNIALAMAARKSGLKLNPYGEGYTDLKTGRVLSCNCESEVFSFVGLPYRRPEHRQ